MYLIAILCVVLSLTIGSPSEITSDGVSRLIEKSRDGKSTKRGKCVNKRCCEFREEIQNRKNNDINCKLLLIDECVLYDDICIWDCEQTRGNGKEKRRGKGKSTFIKFDEGNGYPNDPEVSQSENDEIAAVQNPETISEMQEMTSFLSYDNECGDVYRTDFSANTAAEWLLHQETKSTISGAPDDDINGDDIDGIEDIRRRLQITPPDGRVQTYATKFPYTTAVKIVYTKNGQSKGCSGTMIGARNVLTAAHCLYDVDTDQWGSSYRVLVGGDEYSDFTDSTKWIPWSKGIIPTIYTQKSFFSSEYDVGVIRLSRTPGVGYMGFGSDTSTTVPQYMNTFGYPDDKSYGTLWRQYCSFNYRISSLKFTSTECDIYPGQSGSCEYKYWSSTGQRTIYGVASGSLGTTYTYASRIYSGLFNLMCDFIEEVEPGRCG